MTTTAEKELAHLFRALKAPAAARALPKLAERARGEEWSYRVGHDGTLTVIGTAPAAAGLAGGHDRAHRRQAELCERSTTDYSDLKAFFINCTLKRGPEMSHTQGLMDIAMEIMRRNGVAGRRHPRDRPPDRHRRVARHDRARLGARRLAADLRARHRRRHPRHRDADLARREVIGRARRSSSASTATRTCSTTRASTPTTAAPPAAS